MGTKGSNIIAEISENILLCEICSEPFDSSSRTPRILACYHSFCGICVERLIKDDVVTCPMCRSETPVEGRVPVDTTRVALLDLMKAAKSQEGVACQGCTEDARAEFRCQDCQEFLCGECSKAHRKIKETKSHSVVSLAEAAKTPVNIVMTMENCKRHADKKRDMYCVTCRKAVCYKCALTMHKDGHTIEEIETIVEDKKTELMSQCCQLDQMVPGFEEKLEQSQACLKTVDANLDEATRRVQAAVSDIVTSAMDRQGELLEELRAKAKSDRLFHEEQAATFRSLLSAVQTRADHARRVVSLNLATQVMEQGPQIEEPLAALQKQLQFPVRPAPVYKVAMEKLKELKDFINEFGRIESTYVDSTVPRGPERLRRSLSMLAELVVDLPGIMLDASRCGPDCKIGDALCTLTNQPDLCPPSIPSAQRFRFRGTCSTVPVCGLSYWQVKFVAKPQPRLEEQYGLCEVGLATMEALEAASGGITPNDETAFVLRLFLEGDTLRALVFHRRDQLLDTALTSCAPDIEVDRTFGFLLDSPAERVTITDVNASRVLCESHVDMSRPLWAVVSMRNPMILTQAEISLQVESDTRLDSSSPELAKMFRDILA